MRTISSNEVKDLKKAGAKVTDNEGKRFRPKTPKPLKSPEEKLSDNINILVGELKKASDRSDKYIQVSTETMRTIVEMLSNIKPPKVEVNLPEPKKKELKIVVTKRNDKNLIEEINAKEV